MKSVRLRAFAKVNLSLNITGRTDDGMHELDSVMMSVDKFDTVTVTERSDDKIYVSFDVPGIGADNTAFRAARAVRGVIGGGWDITVQKGIPIGAGLGGSSADGAAVLRALDLMYRLPARGVDMRKIALSVGSDVPFMLTGGLARVRGIGGDLFFMENKLDLFAVGLMSGSVSTAAAYKAFDKMYPLHEYSPTDNDKLCDLILDGDKKAVELFGNALFEPAKSLLPDVDADAHTLDKYAARVNMTGSGGTVLGYFTDINKFAACAAALKTGKGFSVMAPVKTGILHEWLVRD